MNPANGINRAVVLGTSGSGKTTFAAQLAQKLGCPHIELDALYWKNDWQHLEDEETRAAFDNATHGDRWVVDGNYSKARSIIWPKADTLIWLDYPRSLVMRRILRRTFGRMWTRKQLWDTNNVETPRLVLLSKDSVIRWAWTTYERRRRDYTAIFA